MSTKRVAALSIKDKLDIIRAVNEKENKKTLCRKYHCDISTINRIVKKSSEIRNIAESSKNLKKKRQRKSGHDMVEKALSLWFDDHRTNTNSIITSAVLLEKAKRFAATLDSGFKPDLSWIWRWRQREGIKCKKIHGEAGENNSEGAATYQNDVLPQLLSHYSPDDIFNADESALFYKALPTVTMARNEDNPVGNKQQKVRLTLLFLCNSTGTFKRLYAIGKPKNPRCFRNQHIPIKYFNNQKAWMTSKIWNEILKSLNDEFSGKGRKIILFVDNAACHKVTVELSHVKMQFWPPNTTALIQPLDQGVIHAFKKHYRRIIVRKQIFAVERGQTLKEFSKSISILDALRFAYKAWESVKAHSIGNCFKKAGFNTQVFAPDSDDDDVVEIFSDNLEYIECDNNVPCYGSLSEDDIIQDMIHDSLSDDEIEDHHNWCPFFQKYITELRSNSKFLQFL